MLNFRVMYRGPLSSCNYGCTYCPFAKRTESISQLEPDRLALLTYLNWTAREKDCRFRILFTPWGEALIRKWYQSAMVSLSHMEHVSSVAIQTNLSSNLDWVFEAKSQKIAFWATFHPTETEGESFIKKVRFLNQNGIRLSVGVVGLREHFDQILWLKNELPEDVYLWVNAYKREKNYYDQPELDFLKEIDRFFSFNNVHHPSLGENCDAGENSIAIDGEGHIRRCHFVKEPIGNIHDPAWRECLKPRTCPNLTCGCYIGYTNLTKLNLSKVFGQGLLERIPDSNPNSNHSISLGI